MIVFSLPTLPPSAPSPTSPDPHTETDPLSAGACTHRKKTLPVFQTSPNRTPHCSTITTGRGAHDQQVCFTLSLLISYKHIKSWSSFLTAVLCTGLYHWERSRDRTWLCQAILMQYMQRLVAGMCTSDHVLFLNCCQLITVLTYSWVQCSFSWSDAFCSLLSSVVYCTIRLLMWIHKRSSIRLMVLFLDGWVLSH